MFIYWLFGKKARSHRLELREARNERRKEGLPTSWQRWKRAIDAYCEQKHKERLWLSQDMEGIRERNALDAEIIRYFGLTYKNERREYVSTYRVQDGRH